MAGLLAKKGEQATEPHASDHRVIVEIRFSRRLAFGMLAVMVAGVGLFWGSTALARLGEAILSPSPAMTASTVVSYQGKVSVGSTPFNGTG
ncbi:MAG: hypothetical protein Q7O66_20180 [Dehalococcoidia bacterium]|nr:hypothetical protein [Dehalococcoidia bacterium]